MPDSKPGPGPDQPAAEPKGAQGRPPRAIANTGHPQLPAEQPPKVWETGEELDGDRIPGTRRLYLAGVLAVAVLASTVTAIAILDQTKGKGWQEPQTTYAAQPAVPGFTPEAPTTQPSGKSGLSSPEPEPSDPTSGDKDGSDSPGSQQGGAKPTSEPSKSTKPTKKPPSTTTTTTRKSVQSVNYPDRYWHLRSGVIQLDLVSSRSGSETREDSSFNVVSGLAKSSCYSFQMSDGRYVRHQNFRLRVSGNDGSELFRQDATFCPMQSPYSDAVMLQAVNYPDRFLRHKNFELVLDPYGYNTTGRQEFFFRLVKGLG